MNHFKKFLKSKQIEFEFSEAWTDSKGLRKDIHTKFVDIPVDWSKSPPVPNEGSLSLSHCRLGGAAVYSRRILSLGVDLEDKLRLTEKILNRISNPEELKLSRREFIWPVKEAAYKSHFPDNKTYVISDTVLEKWEVCDRFIWQFFAHHSKSKKKLTGYLFDSEPILIAVSFIVSN